MNQASGSVSAVAGRASTVFGPQRTIKKSRTALDPRVAAVKSAILDPSSEYQRLEQRSSLVQPLGMLDYVVACDDEPHEPEDVFNRLRWGGQFIYIASDRAEIGSLPQRFRERGYAILDGPSFIRLGWRIPLLSPKAHYLVARKTQLIPPREFSDRFTYQVELERHPHDASNALPGTEQWIVHKQVPTFERVLARLKFKAPDLPEAVLEKRARKFVDQIFPLFLTREAAMLKIIQRDVPREYAARFPSIIDLQKDAKGYVRQLWTTWLRNGGAPISQIEFAKQSADLLHILHDRIGIIHLDLRMDNMVVTEQGVGFVDFGSAVRVNENIHGNAVLSTLFGELMRTSQVQRMLDRMATAGSLTSHIIRDAYQQVDKAVDLFYLAVQINQPTANPDLRDLIVYDKFSMESVQLANLTHAILRPTNPQHPRYRSARDVLDGILRIEQELKLGRTAQSRAASPPPEPASQPPKAKVYIWK